MHKTLCWYFFLNRTLCSIWHIEANALTAAPSLSLWEFSCRVPSASRLIRSIYFRLNTTAAFSRVFKRTYQYEFDQWSYWQNCPGSVYEARYQRLWKGKTFLLQYILFGILFPKLFWPTVRKNCSGDWEKLLKFEAERQEFAKILRSFKQFVQTAWKARRIFSNRMFF